MAKVIVACPHCGTRYRIGEHRLGHDDECKRCGEDFTLAMEAEVVSMDAGAGADASEAAPPPAESPSGIALTEHESAEGIILAETDDEPLEEVKAEPDEDEPREA